MKKILQIYARDLKAVFTNYAACIVVITLCILPSLYAWFNIKASWDPYGQKSTRGIKIAVVNLDQGAVLNNETVRIGDRIVEELKKNNSLGWMFVSAKEANDLLEEEKIYASVTITEDFSKSLTSIVTEDVVKGKIIYTVNEKINAIAPKLTSKGVTTLQNMISQTVVETVSNTVFDIANEIGTNLKEQLPNLTNAFNKLVEIQSKFGEINRTVAESEDGVARFDQLVKEIKQTIPGVTNTLANVKDLGGRAITFVNTAQGTVDSLAPAIMKDVQAAITVVDQITAGLQGINAMIESAPEQAGYLLDQLQTQTAKYQQMIGTLNGLLQRLNQMTESSPFASQVEILNQVTAMINNMSQLLASAQEQLAANGIISQETIQNLINISSGMKNVLTQVNSTLTDTIAPQMNEIFTKALTTAKNAVGIVGQLQEKIPEVNDLIGIAEQSIAKGNQGLAYVNEVLPEAEAKVNEIVKMIRDANSEEGLRELTNLLTQDMKSRSEFLASPVEVIEETIYPMGNYGTGMTPFYTVLCLWVGMLLLGSMLTVEVDGDYKPYQVYFGKSLIYGTIGLVQALIVTLGDLYLLGIFCKHPVLFILGNLFTSALFTVVIYSLISVFGNVGKVIGIILLVLQVAGSGGTFPIQLTPKFFQALYPFLPFTYCISFNREAIGGIVWNVLRRDIYFMLAYMVVFLVIAVLIKRPVNRVVEKFNHKFHESGLGE